MHRKEKHTCKACKTIFSPCQICDSFVAVSVCGFSSGTPVSSGAKNAVKSMEIKTNARASFTITFCSKNSQRFKVDSFSCQNSVQVVFLGYENVVGFGLSTKFRFSTSSDLQTA